MDIKNITNFIVQVKKLGVNPDCENYFRGHSNKKFKLTPSIYRDGLIEKEDFFFKESILRVPHEFSNLKSTLEKLVKMQHYGVPTRLLDITSNPLVALFFACYKEPESDGEVIFLQIPKNYIKFFDSDTVSVISNIARRPINFEIEYSKETSKADFNEEHHICYLLHEIKEEKPYFQNIINPVHLEEVYAVKVKLDNLRILKQSGAFLLFGVRSSKRFQADVPFEWIMNKVGSKLNLSIPAANKKKILKELDLIGINESTLFPELEYQGKYLIEQYKRE